jgi:hypothetical protein
VKTIKTAGDLFQEQLLHRFGSDFEQDANLCAPGDGPLDGSVNTAGDAFVAELLRRFENDGRYREIEIGGR